MRKVSFGLAVVASLLVGCGGGEAVAPPAAPTPPAAPAAPTAEAPKAEAPKAEEPKPQLSMAELQKKAGMAMGEALNARDAKKLAALYTDNAVVKMAGAPSDLVGRDAVTKHWDMLFTAFSKTKMMSSRVWMKDDVVVVEWGWTGTHAGEFPPGVKATEKAVGAMGVDVMWFTPEGLIKEQHTYHDMGTIMSQIGVSKQKARPVPTLGSAPQMVASTNSADETKNVDALKKMFGAIEKKSEADFIGSATDDITWDDMTQPEAMKGKAAGKKYFADVQKGFKDAKISVEKAWGVGDFVITETTFSGTHTGPFMGMQPTKKAVNIHGVDIVQFKDGKMVKGWTYGNSAEVMVQLGLMPAHGAKDAAKDAKPGAAAPAGKTDAKPAAPAAAPAKTDAKPAAPAAAPAKK